jgi:hypothetical protein
MCDSQFSTHKTDKFTEEDCWKDGPDCTVQPLEPNNFVLLKLATKQKQWNILWGWSKNWGLMVITQGF